MSNFLGQVSELLTIAKKGANQQEINGSATEDSLRVAIAKKQLAMRQYPIQMKSGLMRSSSADLLIKTTNADDRMAGFSVIDSNESVP